MIDPKSGVITFDVPQWVLNPSMTRSQFLASHMGRNAKLHIKNEPYCSWAIKDDLISGKLLLSAVLFFNGEQLDSVELMSEQPPFSWDHHSEEKELKRKELHDEWLSESLANKEQFEWGRVGSVYDKKAGFSVIFVRYGFETQDVTKPCRCINWINNAILRAMGSRRCQIWVAVILAVALSMALVHMVWK